MSDHPENNDISFEDEDIALEEEGHTAKLKKLRDELKEVKKERDEYLTGWQKARAEAINIQKRCDEEKATLRKRANAGLVEELLPAIDAFDMAMANKEVWEQVDEKWRMGIEYILSQLHTSLSAHGLAEITEHGTFNPEYHDPLQVTETDNESEDDTIEEVLQKGYTLNGIVLRPAKVRIKKFSK